MQKLLMVLTMGLLLGLMAGMLMGLIMELIMGLMMGLITRDGDGDIRDSYGAQFTPIVNYPPTVLRIHG